MKNFKKVNLNNGIQIICHFEEFNVSSPRRFVNQIDDKIIEELNKKN